MKKHIPTFVTLALLGLLLPACGGPGFRIRTPDNFVSLEDQRPYAYRATNAQGVVMAVRSEPNRPRGNLAFWADAIDVRLRRANYTPEGEPLELRTTSGLVGRQMRYTMTSGNRPYRYWVTVFVTPARVFTLETGGDRALFDPVLPGIEGAIRSFRAE